MDLSVELPGEGVARVSVPGTARVADVVRVVYQQKGLGPVAEKLTEFSLAKKVGANECIDVAWLDPSRSLQDQGPLLETLVLKKKYFVRNDELQVLDSSEVLLRLLFTQLLQFFKAGLFRCSIFQAAQIIATALKVRQEVERGSPDPSISDEDLKGVLPEHLYQTAGIDQLVVKAMKTLKHVSVQEAQKRFIARLQKLESFGMAFFSAEYEECSGFIGISPDMVCCIEKEGMETFNQWDMSDLTNYTANGTSLTMVFGTNDPVTVVTPHAHSISEFIQGVEHLQMELKFSPPPAAKKPKQDPLEGPPKVPLTPTTPKPTMAATPSSQGPPPERPPPRRPVPAPRLGRVGGDAGNLGGGPKEGVVTCQKEGGVMSPKEDGKSPLPRPRQRLADDSSVDNKGGKGATQPERGESPVGEFDTTPVAYLEPKRSVLRVATATTGEPAVFGMFQKRPERPSMYATVRDSVDALSIILESDLNSELTLSGEDNPIYDANASKEVEICIRSCNATYKALNQSFKQSIKQRDRVTKTKGPPLPPLPNLANGGQQKKVPILPPAPAKPPPPHKPPPILVKGGGGGVAAKLNSNDTRPSNVAPPTVGALPRGDAHQPLPIPTKPKITKVSISKATEDPRGDAYFDTSLAMKGRSQSLNKDTRPPPTITDKVEAPGGDEVVPTAGGEEEEEEERILKVLAEQRGSSKSKSASYVGLPPPKPPRAKKKVQSDEELEIPKQRGMKDYSTLLRDFRIFYVKLPNGHLYTELENVRAPLRKMIHRLCVLVQAEDYSQYSLYVEGSALSLGTTSKDDGEATFDVFAGQACILLPEQGPSTVLLDPEQSLYKQGVHSTRILALRKNALCSDRLRPEPPIVPEWVQFYKYAIGIVQGTQPCSLYDAVKLAALLYQVCILDQIEEMSSVIELCSAEDLISHGYRILRDIADKIHTAHQKYKEYTLKQAQQSYIQICQGLPTHNTVFFPCKEVKQRALLNNKLTPILIGINHDGVVRVDPKTKEILDMWPYQVIQNWGFGSKTLMLHFADSSYPVKTNQGNWMTELINFNVESIISKPKPEPSPNRNIAQNYEQDPNLAERLYEDLLYVEEQPLKEYDVLQHFPAHQPPATFPSPGDYEPVIGGGVYSVLSMDLMDSSMPKPLPNTSHDYEVIRPNL